MVPKYIDDVSLPQRLLDELSKAGYMKLVGSSSDERRENEAKAIELTQRIIWASLSREAFKNKETKND